MSSKRRSSVTFWKLVQTHHTPCRVLDGPDTLRGGGCQWEISNPLAGKVLRYPGNPYLGSKGLEPKPLMLFLPTWPLRAQAPFLHLRKLTFPEEAPTTCLLLPLVMATGQHCLPPAWTTDTAAPKHTLGRRTPSKRPSVTSLLQTSRDGSKWLLNKVRLPDGTKASAHPSSLASPLRREPHFYITTYAL